MAIATNDWTARITGSAFSDSTTLKITAPHGKYIIAMQATGIDSEANNVLAAVVAADSSMHWNSVAASHQGTTSDTVDEGSGISNAATFTMDTSYATKGYAVGWYVDGIGIPYGTKVAAVNVGSSATEITLDTNVNLTDGEKIFFTNPNDKDHGTGGTNCADGVNISLVVGAGYYFGRWLSVQAASDNGQGIIAYFGE
tara:strand:- start:234 stop:827 length:594 start_codon:yes stop_codon:yes gene_type:complete